KIIHFFINENNQWPIIESKDIYYVPIDNISGKIGIGKIPKNGLSDYLKYFK
ncbi:MAG: hypothetical protein HRT99_03715, partial [Mycoplasmatales bacterium]|nr:hypothetical protein [Mycoplasmatales bacterium]